VKEAFLAALNVHLWRQFVEILQTTHASANREKLLAAAPKPSTVRWVLLRAAVPKGAAAPAFGLLHDQDDGSATR
jgi:hypothetical protein